MSDIYRVITTWTGVTGSPYFSTHYFEGGGAPLSAEATSARTKVVNMWNNAIGSISPLVTLSVQTTVDYLSETSGDLITSFAVAGFTATGTSTGEILPLGACLAVRHETGQVRDGRRVRGKTFWPGMTENRNIAGFPDTVIQSALNTASAQLYSPTTAPFFAVWHRPVSGVRPGEAIVATGSSALGYWSNLRSRRD